MSDPATNLRKPQTLSKTQDAQTEDNGEEELTAEKIEQAIGQALEELGTGSVVVRRKEQTFIGPIPSPEHLESYEKICPGAARDIIDMAKREQGIRGDEVRGSNHNERLGLWLSAVVSIALIVVAGYCAYLGQIATAVVIGIAGPVATIMGSLMDRWRSQVS